MDLKNGIFHGKPVWWITMILLLAALIVSLLWAVTIGSVDIQMSDVYRVLLYKTFGIGDGARYGSGSISAADYLMIKRHFLGSYNLYN